VRIGGTASDVIIDVQARTERGTDIKIAHNSRINILEDNQSIRFVSVIDTNLIATTNPMVEDNSARLLVRLNLEITPSATIGFDMNIPPTVGSINASGNGNLRLNIDSRGDFSMFGDFVLQEGFYDLSFEERAVVGVRLITRRFVIERGGTLQWTGNPADVLMDITAVHSTRASLFPVLSANPTATDDRGSTRRVNVQSVIRMEGRLSHPNIKFDFRFPNVDEELVTQFFSAINPEDENEVLRQTVSLLLVGGFIPPENNNLINTDWEAMALDLLFHQVNNIIQNLSPNVNFGLIYKPEDLHHTRQFQVSASTQFWDNRVILDGQFGQSSSPIGLEDNQGFVGEFNAEFRLTNRFSAKVFQRSNERDLAREVRAPYSQGVGVAWRRDFNSLRPLFFSRRREDGL
jgi:hypothetical protein